MTDRNEQIQNTVGEFLEDHPSNAKRHKANLDTNLGVLFLDYVSTPQSITAGQLFLPKVSVFGTGALGHPKLLLATYLSDEIKNRQFWVPFDSQEEDNPFTAEIVATDEDTLLKGWRAAQPLLAEHGHDEQYAALIEEAMSLLKTIGAVALESNDRVQPITSTQSA